MTALTEPHEPAPRNCFVHLSLTVGSAKAEKVLELPGARLDIDAAGKVG